jgi:hypothetical protein
MAPRGDRPDLSKSREWDKKDEYKDRSVPERPVSKHHWKREDTQVDAVPGCTWRPGSRN